MSVIDYFRAAMINSARKTVTRTDKNKGAYVPNKAQTRVLGAAGVEPANSSESRLIQIQVAGTDQVLKSTYYQSVREGSGRRPEYRMGREIVNWVDVDDVLWMGTDGTKVFVFKANEVPEISQTPAKDTGDDSESTVFVEKLCNKVSLERLLTVVRERERIGISSTQFERDPLIRAFAKLRSGFRCEMPDCNYLGFEKPNGETYIEVHHIVRLADEGDDAIDNVVAVCPNCHRMCHYSTRVDEIRKRLVEVAKDANAMFFHERGISR